MWYQYMNKIIPLLNISWIVITRSVFYVLVDKSKVTHVYWPDRKTIILFCKTKSLRVSYNYSSWINYTFITNITGHINKCVMVIVQWLVSLHEYHDVPGFKCPCNDMHIQLNTHVLCWNYNSWSCATHFY